MLLWSLCMTLLLRWTQRGQAPLISPDLGTVIPALIKKKVRVVLVAGDMCCLYWGKGIA